MHKSLFVAPLPEEQERLGDEETGPAYPNLLSVLSHFQQAGVGLGRTEGFRVFLALKQLSEAQKLQSVRFWGECPSPEYEE